jgi:Uma2 family endonuclease
MGIPVPTTGAMTVDEFYAFTETRPDHEKWELIGGEPVLNASPTGIHGMIVSNVITALSNRERQINAGWAVLASTGVRVSDKDRPEPDVLVVSGDDPLWSRDRNDLIVALEVLPPTTKERDLGWKRDAYTGLASVTHYVLIAQDAVNVIVFAREDSFRKRTFRSFDDAIEFRSLGVSLPVAEIYRRTGL